ncbi:MAG: helix-turn-helix domain-containing protein [Candidatus Omnitrophica bacterium]|nr:helix-turn-helix domain-containing protein [Candidatus Omnitrophota bacterium]
MDTMLSVKEASAFLGIGEDKLHEFVSRKIIPAYMIAGDFLRFKKVELEAFKGMLKEGEWVQDGERIFNKAFSRTRGLERLREIARANDVYLIAGILILLVLIITFLRFWT